MIDLAENAARKDLASIKTGAIREDDPSEEDISNREKKYKQCVLMMNIPILSKNYREQVVNRYYRAKAASMGQLGASDNVGLAMHSKGLYNKRFTMITDGNNSNQNLTVNKLLVPKADKIESFLNMTPELYSALQTKLDCTKYILIHQKIQATLIL